MKDCATVSEILEAPIISVVIRNIDCTMPGISDRSISNFKKEMNEIQHQEDERES